MSKQSIYDTICEVLITEGRIPCNYELPHEEVAPNELKFMVGAKDGVAVFHMSRNESEEVVDKIINYFTSGEIDKIAPLIIEDGALQIIDSLLAAIRKNFGKLNAVAIGEYASTLAFESNDEELVKLGIAILGLFDWSDSPEMQEKIIKLGFYEKFTLYVVVAAKSWNNGNDVIFRIAKKVDGWGKINAVERLEPETDEIREWMLREGCENTVMDAYLGLECANKGNLIEVLRRDSLDFALYESVGVIIEALLDEGPVEGISIYDHAEEALLRYLQFAEKYAVTLKNLWHVLNVETSLEFLELSNKDELLRYCSEISSRPMWRERILTALSDAENDYFFYANNTASRLNIDVMDLIYSAVKKDPIKNNMYISKAYKNPEYAKELSALYESVLPLEEIATGMGDYVFAETFQQEHFALDSVLQELRKYPNMGEPLVKAALCSPVIRERNGACAVLEAWSEKLRQSTATFSPNLYEVLNRVISVEVNANTKKTMETLLNGAVRIE